MSGTTRPKQRTAASVDDRAATERSVADRNEGADVAGLDTKDLRALTPEEIQLLAATGC
jgi:hypothetical protein